MVVGDFLIWLSGAQGQILDECPTERPKYVGIGTSILITATMAAVSLAFALVTALKVELWLAMPFAIAWGLAILSLDRLFVVSLSRKGGRLAQVLRATPRVLLALLLGLVISTPFVLQIFRPEIEHEITQLQDQAAVNYFNSLQTSPLSKEIASQEKQVATLQAEAAGTGAGTSTTRSPALASLEQQRSVLQQAQNTALNHYHCELYGPCTPPGNGPVAQHYNAQAQSDSSQIDTLTTQINRLLLQQQTATQKEENLISSSASSRLAQAKRVLNADITEQQRETDDFVAKNKGDTGLLIRLQALGAVTAGNSTLNAARWLLFLLFVVIDCMPVMIKVMLNLGPKNNYDRLLKDEEAKQRDVAAVNREFRKAAEMMAAGTVVDQAKSRVAGWSAASEVTQNIIATWKRVVDKKLEAFENAQIQRLTGEDAPMPGQTADGSQQPQGAPFSTDKAQPTMSGNSGKSPQTGRLEQPHDGKSISSRLSDIFTATLTVGLIIPLVVGGAGFGLAVWQSHLADQQRQDDITDTYIADMKDLPDQGPSAPESQIAEETTTTLRRLDAQHNQTVLQFLQRTHLIGAQHPVIDLSNADLSHADLSGTPLNDIDLKNANLSHADLAGADLSGAILYGADLTGADLSGATLAGASLSSAILTGADLSGADLSGADLTSAYITQPQLDVVRSCTDATLLKGVTCQPICRIVGPRIVTVQARIGTVQVCQKSPPIELTYWYTESGAEEQAILNLVKIFNKKHPDIHVRAVSKGYFQARTAFTTATQDGNAPDVFRSDVTWTPLFASKGYLLNIDSYVSQGDLADYEKAPLSITRGIPPSTTNGIGPALSAPLVYDEYQGGLYGLPQEIDFPVLLYNPKELKRARITRAPATMHEFRTDAAEIVRDKAATYGFEFGGTSYYALPFLYACGGGMFDDNYNILMNNTGSIAGLNFLVNLQNADKEPVMPQEPTFSSPPGTMVTDFAQGRTAMIFDGPHDISQILTAPHSVFDGNPGNLGIAPIPTGVAGQTGSPLGGESYVISAGTAHPADAYMFINFMSSTPSQMAIAKANYTLPTRWSAYEHGASSYPFISTLLSYKNTVVAPPPVPQAAYLFDAADPDIWAALTHPQNSDEAPTADEALTAIAYSWKQVGAGNLVSQFTSKPGTPPAACR